MEFYTFESERNILETLTQYKREKLVVWSFVSDEFMRVLLVCKSAKRKIYPHNSMIDHVAQVRNFISYYERKGFSVHVICNYPTTVGNYHEDIGGNILGKGWYDGKVELIFEENLIRIFLS